jgi:general secretion pathway protein C
MLTPSSATWTVRGATFALWALAAASTVYWALQLGGSPSALRAPAAPPRPVAAVDPAAIARLLGSTPAAAGAVAPAASLASRFQLLGVAAEVSSGRGAAILSVDGKPARPYRVGTMIEEGLILQSVQGRRATLAAQPDGPALVTLELPPLRR